MKKAMIFIVSVLMPIVMIASVFNIPKMKNYGFNHRDLAYREVQRTMSYYEDGFWVPNTRLVPTYHPDFPERFSIIRMDSWDEDDQSWTEGMAEINVIYNNQGRVISYTLVYNLYGMVIPVLKQDSEYDSQSRLTDTRIYSTEIATEPDWELQMHTNFVYGSGTTFEVFMWENDEDFPYTHTLMDFDARGRIVRANSSISADEQNWEASYKTEYEYHPVDKLTGADLIELIAQQFPLMLTYGEDIVMGLQSKMTNYDFANGSWVPDDRILYEYNGFYMPTLRLEEYWASDAWLPEGRDEYFYSGDIPRPSYIISSYHNGSEYVLQDLIDFVWEGYVSTQDLVAPKPDLKVKAYPSPFTDILHVELDNAKTAPVKMEVYNLRGQLMYSDSSSANSLSWNGMDKSGKALPTGVYFVRLSQDGVSGTKRVLKLK